MQDLTGAPAAEVAAERARVANHGLGAQLLALQGADGSWAGEAWNRGWDSTMHVLSLLREMGLDPASNESNFGANLNWSEWPSNSKPVREDEMVSKSHASWNLIIAYMIPLIGLVVTGLILLINWLTR